MRRIFIMTAGILVAIAPFLGFPGSWKNVFFALAGIAIALAEYSRAPMRPRVTSSGVGVEGGAGRG